MQDNQDRSILPSILAALLALMGAALLVGGVVLVSRGGSLYYAIAGAALVANAWLLWRRRGSALWLYAAILLATMGWAVWEVGLDFWQLAPRGDILVPLGLVMLLPWVVRPLSPRRKWPGPAWPLIGALAVAAVVGIAALAHDEHRLEGRIAAASRAPVAIDPTLARGDWPAYGRSLKGNRWSPLTQLTPANVDRLKPVWRFDTGDTQTDADPNEFTYEVTPIKVGNLLYVCTPHNLVIALDAETGKQVWRFDPKIRASKDMQHLTCRGVSYHAEDAVAEQASGAFCAQRIIMGTNDARLIALDALTGRPCAGFGNNGQVDVWPGQAGQERGWWQITSPPVVTRDLIIFGGAVFDNKSTFMPSGVIRAYDVRNGSPVWAFDPGNPGDTSPRGANGRFVPSSPNSWSMASADEALGLVYVPMGMAAIDQWGGRRAPATERFATSVLALDIGTGQLRWVFQTVHHDLWDMDVPAQPALVDLAISGRGRVPALVQSTKTGDIYVLDRRTGQPIFPVEERRVPGGAPPGDRLSLTQPFSSVSFMPKENASEAGMWGAWFPRDA